MSLASLYLSNILSVCVPARSLRSSGAVLLSVVRMSSKVKGEK